MSFGYKALKTSRLYQVWRIYNLHLVSCSQIQFFTYTNLRGGYQIPKKYL
nr:MAG TPA: hypothetical protein [Caudoviricetes sp.]